MRIPHKVIKAHLTSEKSHLMRERQNCYVFEVDRTANKIEIAQAVEELFKVHVKDVSTANVRGKMKRLGRFLGKKPNWKKAVVTVATGEAISQLENV